MSGITNSYSITLISIELTAVNGNHQALRHLQVSQQIEVGMMP